MMDETFTVIMFYVEENLPLHQNSLYNKVFRTKRLEIINWLQS